MATAKSQRVEQQNGGTLPACRPPLPRMTGKARRRGWQGPELLYGTGVSLPEKGRSAYGKSKGDTGTLRVFGWPSSSENAAPRLCRVKPHPFGTAWGSIWILLGV
jgi:hypothetical protein